MNYSEAIAEIDKLLQQYGEDAPEWLGVARNACAQQRALEEVRRAEVQYHLENLKRLRALPIEDCPHARIDHNGQCLDCDEMVGAD